jgi:hypothetical protein
MWAPGRSLNPPADRQARHLPLGSTPTAQEGTPEPVNVNDRLEAILDATRDRIRADATIDHHRAHLREDAIARSRADGLAWSGKRPGVGAVRLDNALEPLKPYLEDPVPYASWVAEYHPEAATATVTIPAATAPSCAPVLSFAGVKAAVRLDLDDVAQLEALLEALRFAGIDGATSTITVDPAFTSRLSELLVPQVDRWKTVTAVGPGHQSLRVRTDEPADDDDPAAEEDRYCVLPLLNEHEDPTGEVVTVPGWSVRRLEPKLVVTPESGLKTAIVKEVAAELAAAERGEQPVEDGKPGGPPRVEAEATGPARTAEEALAQLADLKGRLKARRDELEAVEVSA